MIRRPTGSTRTDTLFPYTTLLRSLSRLAWVPARRGDLQVTCGQAPQGIQFCGGGVGARAPEAALLRFGQALGHLRQRRRVVLLQEGSHGGVLQVSRIDGIEVMIRDGARGGGESEEIVRSGERRVGKEGVSTCRSGWSTDN